MVLSVTMFICTVSLEMCVFVDVFANNESGCLNNITVVLSQKHSGCVLVSFQHVNISCYEVYTINGFLGIHLHILHA